MVDYSKWKDIEISDDEDDTHPNIDTPSLFRWRHQARIERMEEKKVEDEKMKESRDHCERQIKRIKYQLDKKDVENKEELQKSLAELNKKLVDLKEQEQKLEEKDKLQPWNVDTISQEGFSKTIINKMDKLSTEDMTEDEKMEKMRKFIKENEGLMKKYGMFKHYDDSRRFMMDNPNLACEECANYMVIWCINLEMEDKDELMVHVAHQTICVQFILELAKQLDRDPRSCIAAFFHRIQQAEPEYKKAFTDELDAFKTRIKKRAAEKLEEAMKEAEEEERKKRLGPGDLDPVEVFESLPEVLQKCFESQDIELLKKTIADMNPAEASEYMKKCVDSGLWVPDSKDEQS